MVHVFAFLHRVGGVDAEGIEERSRKGASWRVQAKDGQVVPGDGRHKTRHQRVGRGMQNACLLCVRDEQHGEGKAYVILCSLGMLYDSVDDGPEEWRGEQCLGLWKGVEVGKSVAVVQQRRLVEEQCCWACCSPQR